MKQLKAKIILNQRIRGSYFRCVFSAPAIARMAKPGQFVTMKTSDSLAPLLRRPFGIHSAQGARVEVLYEVLGEGTRALSLKKIGEYLDVIGPLGRGFDYQSRAASCTPRIIVAGGMGVAPLFFLAKKIKVHSSQFFVRRPLVLIGAKTKSQLLCEKEFRALGCKVKIATDDGSEGFKGRVTDLLNSELCAMHYELSTVYACGPKPMLKEIALLSKKYQFPAQVSLEEHMSCGFGACMGCAVKAKLRTTDYGLRTYEEYVRVCKEGPVFNADEIIWE
jgi:dihydroorotate dehydrogenase electron transfer subunit